MPKNLKITITFENYHIVKGLRVQNGELYINDQRLETAPPRAVMNNFINFLRPGPVTLIAHNGNRFDFLMLLAEVSQLGLMQEFRAVVCGLMDTLPFLKKKLPERLKTKQSFSQSILAKDLVGADAAVGAHNAIADVRMLEMVLQNIGVTASELNTHCQAVTLQSKITADSETARTKLNRCTLDCLKGNVSTGMLTKMARANITLSKLKNIFADGAEGGIKMLLGIDVNGRPRVTKNQKITQAVVNALKSST
ncbi:uncharacterized protein LOC107265719 [Cephus cinctus]|uniref:Uncharacterized protein LOC107265719 n=1 Tax=Cephus cinctus TaxID=211228 RepID=A0AAJ7BQ92_CEPCN|nr:uncharacterized protein LOC107265719 [Cephus cinctus]